VEKANTFGKSVVIKIQSSQDKIRLLQKLRNSGSTKTESRQGNKGEKTVLRAERTPKPRSMGFQKKEQNGGFSNEGMTKKTSIRY